MRPVILTLWIAVALLLASYFTEHYLLLVWFYGLFRVFKDGLHFTHLPSSKSADDYIVSNGDHISTANAFVGLPMTVILWLVLSIFGFLLVKRLTRLKGNL
jgi:hypothetical protein